MAGVWRFHPNHGGNVRLSPDCTVAENVEDVFGAATGCLVFTDAPIPLGSHFVLRGIDAPLYQPRLGLTTMCPDNMTELPSTLSDLHSSSFEDSWLWTINETVCSPDGDSDIIVIEGTNVNPKEAHRLGLTVTPEGDLHLLADDKVIGVDWRSVPTNRPLWGVAEVHLTKLKLEIQAPRYLWEFVSLADVRTNSLCDINLEVEKGTVIKAYVPESFKSMMDVAKGGFYMWANTGRTEGWVHSSNVRDITTENYKELLATAMEDGFIVATIIKILIIGPPGVGKTGVKQLLLGMPPPDKRNSTPIATGASRAVAETQDGLVVWKEVDTNALLDILAQAIKHIRSGLPNPSLTTSISSSLTLRAGGSASSLKLLSSSEESLYQSSIRNWFHAPKGAESPATRRPVTSSDRILEKMLFKEDKEDCREQKTWIYCVDCGGERAYLDILPAFVRGSTINVLAIDLSDNLNEKLQAEYVREDEPLKAPSNLHQTSLELAEGLMCSFSSLGCHFQNASSSPEKPKFLVVGTHDDKIKQKKRYKDILSTKDQSVQKALQGYRDLCIRGGPDGQLIYPLDTRAMENRESTAANLRQKIMEAAGNSIEAAIPSRWHALEVELQRRTEKVNRTVLALAECIRVGATMNMEELDVEDALVFFDELTIYFYFPTAAPHIVFTVPQDLLDEATGLLEIGLVSIEHLPANIPHQLALRLRQEGLFNKQLVALACQKFRVYIGEECVYTVDDFLAIMKHLLILAPVTLNGEELFFLPCVLPYNTQVLEEKRKYTQRLEPILLFCECQVVFQGMFPAIMVVLLSRQTGPQFTLIGQQFRNAITLRCTDLGGALFLTEHLGWVELCYSGNPKNATEILGTLYESIFEVCSRLSYTIEEGAFKEGFWCNFPQRGHSNESHPCLTVTLPSGDLELSCSQCPDLHKESSDPRQVAWIRSLPDGAAACTPSVAGAYGGDSDPMFFEHIACWMPDKWKETGRILGILESQLSAIEKKHANPLDCFADVLSCWQTLPCSRSIDRWSRLIDVLYSPQLGEKDLADSLNEQFVRGANRTESAGTITGNLFVEKVASAIPTKWKQVGIELNLPKQVIEHIAQRHHGSPRHCCSDMFVLWRKLPFTCRPVSWQTLITTLRSAAIGATELADKLEEELVQGETSTFPNVTGEGFMEHIATAIPGKWRLVGRALGLTHQQLDQINRQKEGNPDSCYSEVFDCWHQHQHFTCKPISWAIVTAALRSPIVGEDHLASRLEEQFVTSISGNDFLQQVAHRAPEKWRSIGRALGIPGPKITEIDQKYHEESDNCYAEVFVAWQRLPSTRKPVSWSTLVEALRSPGVGETELANTLEEVFVRIENYVFV